jgi:hypothetical protein
MIVPRPMPGPQQGEGDSEDDSPKQPILETIIELFRRAAQALTRHARDAGLRTTRARRDTGGLFKRLACLITRRRDAQSLRQSFREAQAQVRMTRREFIVPSEVWDVGSEDLPTAHDTLTLACGPDFGDADFGCDNESDLPALFPKCEPC